MIYLCCLQVSSPNTIEFENFPSDFSELLNKIVSFNSLFTIILGDFNLDVGGKKNKITEEGTQLEALTLLYNF